MVLFNLINYFHLVVIMELRVQQTIVIAEFMVLWVLLSMEVYLEAITSLIDYFYLALKLN